MKSEKATFTQMLFSIVLFNFGSSVIMGVSDGVAQDAWVAIVLGAVLIAPVLCLYARLFRLFPEKDLFEIMQLVFGKVGGKVLTVLFVWYATHLAALVLRDFSEFTQIVAMNETPQLPIMILMILTTVYLTRSGMRAIGKWSLVTVFLVLGVVALTFLAAIPQLNLDDLMPFFEHSPVQIAQATFGVFAFPYAETVIFLGLAGSFEKKDNPYKLFLYALSIILLIFIIVFLRNLTLLGNTLNSLNYFPSYVTVRIIGIGDFLARMEGSISSNFLLAGIVKIAACLLAASKGMASLFNMEHYRPIVLPMGMLVLAICSILYENTMQMFAFLTYYPYYAFPFQVILPLAVWIGGEIYVKKHKKTDLGS
ncbi:MAG: endospore germination permease [Candidatus Pelethousia sp.]|nr:endospore germination permease [Candidatus Pelethousia sp.]